MFATCRVLFVLALGVGFVGVPTARADDKNPEKPQPAAEPAKTIVIQIDASKLPPDVLKQLLQLAEKPKQIAEPVKPGVKPGAEPVKPGVKPGAEPVKPGVKPGAEPVKPGVKPAVEPVKPGVKPGAEPVKPGVKPAVEPVKPGVKPGAEPVKPGTKVISLGDAIAIAEKTAQGTAVKAERKTEDGAIDFKVEVQGAKGGKTNLTIDASGKVTGTENKEGEKGKGKKKKND